MPHGRPDLTHRGEPRYHFDGGFMSRLMHRTRGHGEPGSARVFSTYLAADRSVATGHLSVQPPRSPLNRATRLLHRRSVGATLHGAIAVFGDGRAGPVRRRRLRSGWRSVCLATTSNPFANFTPRISFDGNWA